MCKVYIMIKNWRKSILFLGLIILLILVFYTLYHQCLVNWTLMFITLMFVFTALFQNSILNFIYQPKISIFRPKTITNKDETVAIRPVINSETGLQDAYYSEVQAYIVIQIKNYGFGVAKNVNVFLSGVNSNARINFHRYKSLHLRESWTGIEYITSLHPGSIRCFTLGNVFKNSSNSITIGSQKNSPVILQQIECTEKPTYFEFFIEVFADNTKLVKRKVRIEFDCDYFNKLKIIELPDALNKK